MLPPVPLLAGGAFTKIAAALSLVKYARGCCTLEAVEVAPIILILGRLGAGKSTFINLLAGDDDKVAVSDGADPCTSELSYVNALIGGNRCILVDTPGFNEANEEANSDVHTVAQLAMFLHQLAEAKIYPSGVILMHDINEVRFSEAARTTARIVEALCGPDALQHVIICANRVDREDPDKVTKRLSEFDTPDKWGEMITAGARVERHSNETANARVSAENLIASLRSLGPVELLVQRELVGGKKLHETTVGEFLRTDLEQKSKKLDDQLKTLTDHIQGTQSRRERLSSAARLNTVRTEQNQVIMRKEFLLKINWFSAVVRFTFEPSALGVTVVTMIGTLEVTGGVQAGSLGGLAAYAHRMALWWNGTADVASAGGIGTARKLIDEFFTLTPIRDAHEKKPR